MYFRNTRGRLTISIFKIQLQFPTLKTALKCVTKIDSGYLLQGVWLIHPCHHDNPPPPSPFCFAFSMMMSSCHQMETFSALLAICAGNSPVTGEFPTQRPVTRSFDVFFDLRLNKRLSEYSWGWWFETPSRPFWRHCNGWLPFILHSYAQQLNMPLRYVVIVVTQIWINLEFSKI